ncbi:MAG: hypothetical protein Q8N44_07735 [Rubrivivax sp.]|nr:hypothetical protein [Rubrivivax sp.]
MSEDATSLPETTPLLWLLAWLVAALAAWVAMRSMREARRARGAGAAAHVVAGSLALGSGIWAAMVIGISSQAWAFPIGFRQPLALGAWALALLLSAPAVTWMGVRPRRRVAFGCGLLLALAALAVQALLLQSMGFDPGLHWRSPGLAMAPLTTALGSTAALGIAFIGPGRSGRSGGSGIWRKLWRLLAGVLFGLALVLGQDMLMEGGRISAQVASAHHAELPALLLSVAATLLVLPLLGLLAIDQHWRRHVAPGQAPQGLMSVLAALAQGSSRKRRRPGNRL